MTFKETRKITFEPSVMLVGLPDREAGICTRACDGVAVHRVAHAQAAVERMIVTRPIVVVLLATLPEADLVVLRERSEDVGARLLTVAEGAKERALTKSLRAMLQGKDA